MLASGTCGTNITWQLEDNGTLIITGNGAISFSSQPWSKYIDQIVSLNISEGITSICKNCFTNLANIVEVTLPSTLTSILDGAFSNCSGIKRLYLTSIQDWLKAELSNSYSNPANSSNKNVELYVDNVLLTNLVIPQGTTYIKPTLFQYFNSIQTVSIPDSVITIDDNFLNNCNSLKRVDIPDSVQTMGSSCIYQCASVEEVYFGNGIEKFPLFFGVGLSKLKKIVVGSKMADFRSKPRWTPCASLKTVEISESNPNFAAIDNIVYSKDLKTVVMVPPPLLKQPFIESATKLDPYFYKYKMKEYIMQNTITELGDRCFITCESLTKVVLSNKLTLIPESTFSGCKSLTEVIIPNSVTKINSNAFSGCTSLTSIKIPRSVSELANPSILLNNGALAGASLSEVLICNPVPPTSNGGLKTNNLTVIKVPIGSGEAYKTSSAWSSYADYIVESIEANLYDPGSGLNNAIDQANMLEGWIVGQKIYWMMHNIE